MRRVVWQRAEFLVLLKICAVYIPASPLSKAVLLKTFYRILALLLCACAETTELPSPVQISYVCTT